MPETKCEAVMTAPDALTVLRELKYRIEARRREKIGLRHFASAGGMAEAIADISAEIIRLEREQAEAKPSHRSNDNDSHFWKAEDD